ncbi:hypothetical protein Emtol_1865 [Emticicia oligotrophica DSM 17448]|uniref:Uncharacterized protein n=1 Tax=Emticicia oligotrophica (strain DSM 17448 / CIP 109782 / MTCC 6937 / GPTSA100-15) TaxID=929562 RepID=A0ABM5N0Y2_EMTOG|nr:hypothetical protein [Emticicia oligotrophica]AFK03007.1 hypothetical protein Emtol_1865 [Emticicia oligotrophica DSM 17448]
MKYFIEKQKINKKQVSFSGINHSEEVALLFNYLLTDKEKLKSSLIELEFLMRASDEEIYKIISDGSSNYDYENNYEFKPSLEFSVDGCNSWVSCMKEITVLYYNNLNDVEKEEIETVDFFKFLKEWVVG